jgi:hypothetical protein
MMRLLSDMQSIEGFASAARHCPSSTGTVGRARDPPRGAAVAHQDHVKG